MRLWPRSLFGRLVMILVAGMLAAQVLTSSIWFDVRHSQVLEIPTRLIATRLADIVRLDHADPEQASRLIGLQTAANWQLTLSDRASAEPDRLSAIDEPTERLLQSVLAQKSGYTQPLQLLRLELLDRQGQGAGLSTLLTAQPTAGRYLIDLQLPDGRWLKVQATEEQGWSSRAPLDLLFDFVVRIYLLRILVVVLIALLAVRLAIRPLNQLAEAAQRLGRDIHRAPLPLTGPVEVRRAAEAFNLMQQRLIANIAERTRFLAAISHDLRSPITRLRLRAERVSDPLLQTQLRNDLEDMEQMVASTLDFVSSGELNETRQPIDLNALLMGLQADLEDLGHAVPISGRAQAPVLGHARSLKRCVQNLLENAVRYGERASVQVVEGPGRVCIEIRDHGPGIPAQLLAQVLEPYYRIEGSRNPRTGGYGLGLSIALALAKAHGGSLALSNAQGGGLRAVLELPRQND